MFKQSLLILVASISLAGCGTDNPFDRGEDHFIAADPADGTAVEGLSFTADVIPALQVCASCHSSGAGGWTYGSGTGSFSSVIDKIDMDSPENSLLLIKATGGGGHGGGAFFTVSSLQYQAIVNWIAEGAKDN